MRIVGLTVLHYGTDYLAWALRSVVDVVNTHYILYTPQGSHGHRTAARCPDTRHALYREAVRFTSNIRWIDGLWNTEGEQRDAIFALEPDADLIVVVDADEVYPRGLVQAAIAANLPARNVRLPMIHFWRSFKRAVLHDPAYPVRLIFPKRQGELTFNAPRPLLHFGYAQRSELVRYKLETHGHKNEFRRDCDWFKDKFMANAQTDCHPVGSEYWNPEPTTSVTITEVADHPYANFEVIP